MEKGRSVDRPCTGSQFAPPLYAEPGFKRMIVSRSLSGVAHLLSSSTGVGNQDPSALRPYLPYNAREWTVTIHGYGAGLGPRPIFF